MAKRKRPEPSAVDAADERSVRRLSRNKPSPAPRGDIKPAEERATKTKTTKTTKTKAAETKTVETKTAEAKDGAGGETAAAEPGRQYWLLKAEPETRLENGVDVRFSIDDLAAKTEPEPWDGIRNYSARNNLRAMKKGDLAFFYHSNCKVPGIVGTMEIVREHSPDVTAHDPKAPYYDASSKPSDPKWSVVHVAFRSKFKEIIPLPQLRAMGAPGQPLEHMQLLKQSRLSVSKVSPAEWAHLTSVAKGQGAA